jgi:glutaredoxin
MIYVYGGQSCNACEGVKSSFDHAGVEYIYVDVFNPDIDKQHKDNFFGGNFRSIPQIFRDNKHLGSTLVVPDVIADSRGQPHEPT